MIFYEFDIFDLLFYYFFHCWHQVLQTMQVFLICRDFFQFFHGIQYLQNDLALPQLFFSKTSPKLRRPAASSNEFLLRLLSSSDFLFISFIKACLYRQNMHLIFYNFGARMLEESLSFFDI